MNLKNISKLLLFVLIISTACVNTTQKTTTKGSFIYFSKTVQKNQHKQGDSIKIFYEKKPDYKFSEIGLVEAVAEGKNVSLQDLFPELQKQAAKMNADAIYKIELTRYKHTNDALHATAIAIKHD